MISYGKQSLDQSDIDSVVKVLKGDWLTQGPAVETFENDLSHLENDLSQGEIAHFICRNLRQKILS